MKCSILYGMEWTISFWFQWNVHSVDTNKKYVTRYVISVWVVVEIGFWHLCFDNSWIIVYSVLHKGQLHKNMKLEQKLHGNKKVCTQAHKAEQQKFYEMLKVNPFSQNIKIWCSNPSFLIYTGSIFQNICKKLVRVQ